MKLELSIPKHVGAEDVGRHEIWRELDTTELDIHGLAERSEQQRLAQTRDTLEQDVALAQQSEHDRSHELDLTDDDVADLGLDRANPLGECFWCHEPNSVK